MNMSGLKMLAVQQVGRHTEHVASFHHLHSIQVLYAIIYFEKDLKVKNYIFTCHYELRVTLFVSIRLLNCLTDFNQICFSCAVWSNSKDRVIYISIYRCNIISCKL